MCSSSPEAVGSRQGRPGRARTGLSMLEVLIAASLFVVALVPVSLLFGSARRVGVSADRLLRASNHAQMLLDAVAHLEVADLPPLGAGTTVLLDDQGGGAPPNGTRWDEIRAWFETTLPFDPPEGSTAPPDPTPVQRRLVAEDLGPGGTLLKLEIAWQRLPTVPELEYRLVMVSLIPPDRWGPSTPTPP